MLAFSCSFFCRIPAFQIFQRLPPCRQRSNPRPGTASASPWAAGSPASTWTTATTPAVTWPTEPRCCSCSSQAKPGSRSAPTYFRSMDRAQGRQRPRTDECESLLQGPVHDLHRPCLAEQPSQASQRHPHLRGDQAHRRLDKAKPP